MNTYDHASLDGTLKYFEAKRLIDALAAKLTTGQFIELYKALAMVDGTAKLRAVMREVLQVEEQG